nr:uncharacterized protein LOC128679830 [Plodia interpunctella]
MNSMQAIFFLSKYNLKNDVIKPNGLKIIIMEIIILVWSLKSLTFIGLFITECERFYKSIVNAKLACIMIATDCQSSGKIQWTRDHPAPV